ncbi:MAG: argininosuccinate synthase [Candidatus Bipolaricaulia bacterium]
MKATASYLPDVSEVDHVLLLFSGGLDTSCMVKWIQARYEAKVSTLTIDLGGSQADLETTREKALKLGAVEAYIIDAKETFADHYVTRVIKANGLYQGAYPLSTAIARYLKSELAVKTAEQIGIRVIAHGSTGKGNDQIRFEASMLALNPELKVFAPVREWEMSRDEELRYAQEQNIPIPSENVAYSIDENLWGRSIEAGVLEDPAVEPPQDAFMRVRPVEEAPDTPTYVEIEFEGGVPVGLNGERLNLVTLIERLNTLAGEHGIGIIDMTEDRVVGIKSREVYECPAAVTLIAAHRDLERYVSTIHTNQFKPLIDHQWTYFTYAGLWYDPLMDALNAFIDQANARVSGTVRMKLYKGQARVVGRTSEYALYEHQLTTYEEGSSFNQRAAPGFVELWSLPTRMARRIAGPR